MPWWDPDADASVSPETDTVTIGGQQIGRGSRVRLRPGARRADAQDMFLVGRIAEVQAVLYDVEDNPYLAVSLADQPDEDLRIAHGRFLYFSTDEVEPCEPGRRAPHDRADAGGGMGNVFLRDDAFGCEVVRQLAERPVPDGVQVRDFGIRGVHLAYDLLDGCDLFVLVDAAPRGEPPGTVTVLEVEVPEPDSMAGPVMDAHRPDAGRHLRAARLARRPARAQPGGGLRAGRRQRRDGPVRAGQPGPAARGADGGRDPRKRAGTGHDRRSAGDVERKTEQHRDSDV